MFLAVFHDSAVVSLEASAAAFLLSSSFLVLAPKKAAARKSTRQLRTTVTAKYINPMGLSTMNCPMIRAVTVGPMEEAMVKTAPATPVTGKRPSSHRSPVANTEAFPKPKIPEATWSKT